MKLSNKHFNLFKKLCQKNINKLHLNHWKVYFDFKDTKEEHFGYCEWRLDGKSAKIVLNKVWDVDVPIKIKEQLKQTANHECLELLLAPLTTYARQRDYIKEVYDKESHSVIRILEKLI